MAIQRKKIPQLILRTAIGLVLLWALFVQLFQRHDIGQIWPLFQQQLASARLSFLLAVVVLMPINWMLETLKWRQFTQPWSGMTFLQSVYGVLAGVAASMLLPNRSGDYLGRWLLAPADHKTKILLSTVASNYCQLLVLLGLGIPSLLYLSHYWQTGLRLSNAALLPLFMGLLIVLLLLGVLIIPRILRHCTPAIQGAPWRRWAWAQAVLRALLELLDTFRWRSFARGILLAGLRYVLYSVQYYLILRFYGVHLPLDAALAGVGTIYLLQTAVPLPPVLGILARGEIALLVWSIWGANALSTLAASYSLFALNLVIPALLGVWIIVRKW